MVENRNDCSPAGRLPVGAWRLFDAPAGWRGEVHGLSNNTGDPPKPRSFADAAALLPSVVPVPSVKPAEAPPQETPAAQPDPAPLPAPKAAKARVSSFAAALPPGRGLPFGGPDGLLARLAAFVRRRIWLLALPLAVAGGVAAWHGVGHRPLAAGDASSAAPAFAPHDAGMSEAGADRPQPESPPPPVAAADQMAAGASPAQPAAMPADKPGAGSRPAAAPDAAPVPYGLVVLHPRPASAAGDAANSRAAALLHPLTARLEVHKQAGTKGQPTVHYFPCRGCRRGKGAGRHGPHTRQQRAGAGTGPHPRLLAAQRFRGLAAGTVARAAGR